MTDKIMIWFECANPQCNAIHKHLNKSRRIGDRPICFMSYVLGRVEFSSIERYLVVYDNPDDDLLPEKITLWHESGKNALMNSYIHPIKNIRYCSICSKILNTNNLMESYFNVQ